MAQPISLGPPFDAKIHASPETDLLHSFWTPEGVPIPSAWLAAGLLVPTGKWGSTTDQNSSPSTQPRTHGGTRQSAPSSPPSVAQPGVRRDRPGGGITR